MRHRVSFLRQLFPLLLLPVAVLSCVAQPAPSAAPVSQAPSQTQPAAPSQGMPELVTQLGGGMNYTYNNPGVFGANGRWLATAGSDGEVLLFDLRGGHISHRFEGTATKSVVAAHPSRDLLAILSDRSSERALMLYDVERGVALWQRTTALVCSAIHFSPDGSRLLGICAPVDTPEDTVLKAWDTTSGSEIPTPAIAEGYVPGGSFGAAFSEDGRWVAAGRPRPATLQPNGKMTRNPLKAAKLMHEYMSAMQDRAVVDTTTGSIVAHTSAMFIFAISAKMHSAVTMSLSGKQESLQLVDLLAPSAKPRPIQSASYLNVQATRDGTHFVLFGMGNAALVDAETGVAVQSAWNRVPMLATGIVSNDGDQVAYAETGSVTLFRFSRSGEGEILGNRQQPLLMATGSPGEPALDPLSPAGDPSKTGAAAAGTANPTGASSGPARKPALGQEGLGDKLKDAIPVYGMVRQIKRQKQQSTDAKEAIAQAKIDAAKPPPENAMERQMKQAFLTFGGPIMVPPAPAFLDGGRLLAVRSADFTWSVWDVATGNHVTGRSTPPSLDQMTESSVWEGRGGLLEVQQKLGLPVKDSTGAANTSALSRTPDGQQVVTHPIPGSSKPVNTTGADDPAGYGLRVSDASGKLMYDLPDARGDASGLLLAPGGRVLVGPDHARTLGIWDRRTGTRLGSLTAYQEGEWLLTTPSGLFDGSPRGWQQIAWRDPNGGNATLPGEAFFSEFYRPGLLAELLSGNAPQPPRTLAQIDRRQPAVDLRVEKATANERTGTLILNLSEAREGGQPGGVRDVRLFRNEVLVQAWRGELKLEGGRTTLTASVRLIAGENRFTAYAFNRDNVKSLDSRVTVQSTAPSEPRTAYIVAVGVNGYSNSAFNLNYAVPDATHFSDVLATSLRAVGQFQRVVQVNLLNEDATKLNLQRTLDLLNGRMSTTGVPPLLAGLQQTRPGDTVVLYFAGHGVAWQDHFYLIPHDLGYTGSKEDLHAGLQEVLAHGMSDEELEDRLNPLDAANIMLVIDACNSGKALDADDLRRGPMNSKGLAQLAYEKGMYVLTASQADQAALESSRLGHGYLTYALADEGLLTAQADTAPADGKITVAEWFEYASRRVPEMQSQLLNAPATPSQRKIVFETSDQEEAGNRLQTPRLYYRREQPDAELVVSTPGRN